eukprot:CAMPEP_0204508824 /NCGR_PEP_ID=MMETSP0471-20130131/110458_1 /ASSEMBLY_ACC=CAM_ASM_000602 /TAXON_ID=2969 /ORGANISM="Oxyrrhis marina" /LENGTH=129 /DNA_ID=CAMNT_0051513857 /DNA_START=1124 /DNA_END=1510 /DNA_ORIENTATION=+
MLSHSMSGSDLRPAADSAKESTESLEWGMNIRPMELNLQPSKRIHRSHPLTVDNFSQLEIPRPARESSNFLAVAIINLTALLSTGANTGDGNCWTLDAFGFGGFISQYEISELGIARANAKKIPNTPTT